MFVTVIYTIRGNYNIKIRLHLVDGEFTVTGISDAIEVLTRGYLNKYFIGTGLNGSVG